MEDEEPKNDVEMETKEAPKTEAQKAEEAIRAAAEAESKFWASKNAELFDKMNPHIIKAPARNIQESIISKIISFFSPPAYSKIGYKNE